jgi:hypothetical protein
MVYLTPKTPTHSLSGPHSLLLDYLLFTVQPILKCLFVHVYSIPLPLFFDTKALFVCVCVFELLEKLADD